MLRLKQCLKDIVNWCKKFDDTGWLQLTGPLENVVRYRRKNGYVFVQTSAGNKALTASAWTTVGTLPAGFRPSQEILMGSDTAGATNRAVAASLYPSGEIKVYTTSATNYFKVHSCFPLD